MLDDLHVPSLPDEILLGGPDADDEPFEASGPEVGTTLGRATERRPFPPFRIRLLVQGAYFLQWLPTTSPLVRYNGTMRVERHHDGVTASGDLYSHPAFKIVRFPILKIVPNPDPSPSAGIPIFPRGNYRYYLRVTQILEWLTVANNFTLGFELYKYDPATHTWTNQGAHTAKMHFRPAPASYPSGATYLEGTLRNGAGANLGRLRMGWVSRHLRKATVEVDRVNVSEHAADNGAGIDWRAVFDAVDWDVDAYESDIDLTEPSGQSWSDAEMHAEMLVRRDSADLDRQWRYHLICVQRLDSTSRGIMYDAFAGDSNNIPREGAGISSHWMVPDADPWGTVKGMRFGEADGPYFRTAVHELGHAMGLYHNTADNGFLNTTNTIAASPGVFPSNVQWSFNAADAKRLRHMPDPWVRPGMIPFGNPYGSAPISPADMVDLGGILQLTVDPVRTSVPLGAPVRVGLTLVNASDTPLEVPASLSLKDEHVSGTVRDPAQNVRSFRSIVRCVEDREMRVLQRGDASTGDMTLLRGWEGELFPSPGLHRIDVNVVWESDGIDVRVTGSTSVMVTAPVDAEHADAARKTLAEPDLLLTVAIGGDHLAQGNAALDAAMGNETLAPHYAAVAAKKAGRRFGDREGDPNAALRALGTHPVVTQSEAHKVAAIIDQADPAALKEADDSLGRTLTSVASDDATVHRVAEAMGG